MPRRKYSQNADHNEVINSLYESIRRLESDNRQLKLALGSAALSCTWDAFVRDIKAKHREIGALLAKAYVRRFEKGRIWLAFRQLDPESRALVAFQLKPFLALWSATKFGQPFVIKIKITDS